MNRDEKGGVDCAVLVVPIGRLFGLTLHAAARRKLPT